MNDQNQFFMSLLLAPFETAAAPAVADHNCGEFGYVIECDGFVDVYKCPVCDRRWTGNCPDADLWRPDDGV